MLTKLVVSPLLDQRLEEVAKILKENSLSNPHPDLLYFKDEDKLGIEETKKIRQFLSLKPFQASGRAVVLISAQNLSLDAQNSLLKTLEEPPEQALILLGADNKNNLLPTILSRAQIINVESRIMNHESSEEKDSEIEKLKGLSLKERFEYIEKKEDKQQLLQDLLNYFHKQGQKDHSLVEFNKKLLKAEQWQKANVNIRAILEYLMLELP